MLRDASKQADTGAAAVAAGACQASADEVLGHCDDTQQQRKQQETAQLGAEAARKTVAAGPLNPGEPGQALNPSMHPGDVLQPMLQALAVAGC